MARDSFDCQAEGHWKPITTEQLTIASSAHICEKSETNSALKKITQSQQLWSLYICLVYLRTTSAVTYCVKSKSHLKSTSMYLKTL